MRPGDALPFFPARPPVRALRTLGAALAVTLACLAAPVLQAAPTPPPGYDRARSRVVKLGEGVVLRAPELLWSGALEGGLLRLLWTAETEGGLALVTRTIAFRGGRMQVGDAAILRQGGEPLADPAGPKAGAPVRPHQPLLLPGAGAGDSGPARDRLVWVEGSPGARSLWVAPLEGDRLGPAEQLASPSQDARAPAVVAALAGEDPGATLAWIEGTGAGGRLVVARSAAGGAFGSPAVASEGTPVLAFALGRRERADYGLVLERTGETTARLRSFRLVWPDGGGAPGLTLQIVSPRVGLPERDRLDFAWAVSPAGRLYVLAIVVLRDRSVLPAAYLFQVDADGLLAPIRTVPLQPRSQPRLTWSQGLDLTWTAPDQTGTWQVLSARLDPDRPGELAGMPVTAGWQGSFVPSALRDPQGNLHAAWVSPREEGWQLLYRTDRVQQTTLLADRLESVASSDHPERLLALLGFFAFFAVAALLPAQGPALLLVWGWERVVGREPSRWLWLAGVLAADLVSRVGLLPLWSPEAFDLGAWALAFRTAYLLPPLLAVLWLRWRPAQASTHRGRWELALFYLAAQVAVTAWPFTLWKMAGLG
ncbi:hypothetical protein [Limnochorda pilosa]|uniref:Uncharacterized protein n=1 Tax=Limnochorda pilosa TaxID=1555112 RepID=A0A0K2SG36_LIMPI|nr:hypothetical protein [Limnochorda pilosa]BAS26055.1 hypothetical protein LIP_0198 [Limnochorda pilosa]